MRQVTLPGLLAVLVMATGSALVAMDPLSTATPLHEQGERDTLAVQLADGLTLTLWASESMVAGPVALAFDDQGRAYVARTNRRKTSVLDIRAHTDWMTDDLALQTVEDKRAFLHRMLDPARSEAHTWLADLNGDSLHDWRDLTVETEQVLRLEDTDGDGRADVSAVFAEGFNTDVTGVAAGVLPHAGDVFLTVAPDLWRLRDTDGDGRADARTSISYGYGNHLGFAGHDMSGLTVGPDGKLYWSIGDLGVHVVGPDGRPWVYPNQGAVMRANPDGSDFEVFAHGLRNAQELAFDDHGNLFSVDNDGDYPGEHERVVYLVEGSDSGWRTNWQYGKYDHPDNNDYNVWLAEGLYKPYFDGQAAYITPPVAPAEDGPAGFAYNPGTALDARWQGYFFVAQFMGSSARSHINAFRVRPSGATFELAEVQEVLKGIQATGLSFGPDGALYVADWLEGWDKKDQGRVWRLDVEEAPSPERLETRRLLAAGMHERSDEALGGLLQHADQRVRMAAQFELARRGAAEQLLAVARSPDHALARLHGIWGLGQLGRVDGGAVAPLVPLLQDKKVREQAAKVLGEARYAPAFDDLVRLLDDPEARVRFFAAEALGKLGDERAFAPLVGLLAANDDADPYLRHAGAVALARLGAADALAALAGHRSRAARLAAVVALRRLQDPGVAVFLRDHDERVMAEAARAIHDDASIEAALPALAAVLDRSGLTSEPLLRRAVSANLRLGGEAQAQRLAAFAARASAPEAMRAEALAALAVWGDPPPLDRVEGRYRPLGTRDTAPATVAVAPVLDGILSGAPDTVRIAAASMVGRLRFRAAGTSLLTVVDDARQSPGVRLAALRALGAMRHVRLDEAVERALADDNSQVRREAQRLTTLLSKEAAVPLLVTVLEHGSVEEQQEALAALGAIDTDAAHDVLSALMDSLSSGALPAAVHLDLLEAAENSGSEAVAAKAARYAAAKPRDEPLAAYTETLAGGHADAGRQIVYRHPGAQCMRCHQIQGQGGEVGPDLTEVGTRLSRRALLESLIEPSAALSPGYGTVVLTLKDGTTVAGVLADETETNVVVQDGSGRTTVAVADIASRTNVPSAMPPMGGILSKSQIRDVIAFLATLTAFAPD